MLLSVECGDRRSYAGSLRHKPSIRHEPGTLIVFANDSILQAEIDSAWLRSMFRLLLQASVREPTGLYNARPNVVCPCGGGLRLREKMARMRSRVSSARTIPVLYKSLAYKPPDPAPWDPGSLGEKGFRWRRPAETEEPSVAPGVQIRGSVIFPRAKSGLVN